MNSQGMRGITPYLALLMLVVTLGPHQFGFHLAELNAPADVITCKKTEISNVARILATFRGKPTSTPVHDFPDCIQMTDAMFATVSSVFTIGGLLGALGAGPLCTQRGRWLAMQSTALVYLLGSIVETFAASVSILGIGRFLNGMGAGASTVIVPLYISEVAPPKARGFFGVFTQISVNVGILFTQTLGYFLSHDSAWRWILGTGMIIAAAQGLGLFLVPESPAWVAAHKGDVPCAKRILQRIRGKDAHLEEEVAAWGAGSVGAASGAIDASSEEQGLLSQEADAALRPMTPKSATGDRRQVGFFQVVRDPLYRRAIFAVIGIMFAQQLCGINSVILYSVSLLDGMLPINSGLVTIITSAVNLLMTIASSPLPDRLGRKRCLLISIVGQGSSSLALALSIIYDIKILSAVSFLTFVAFFAVGLGPVPFMMAPELVGQEAVGATQSWSLGANYVATFLVAQFFPILNNAMNDAFGGAGWVYFVFAALAGCSALFVSVYVPETKGKKDADEVWGRTRRVD